MDHRGLDVLVAQELRDRLAIVTHLPRALRTSASPSLLAIRIADAFNHVKGIFHDYGLSGLCRFQGIASRVRCPPSMATLRVIPAQAGIQDGSVVSWTPAFAGVTKSAFYAAICNRQDVFTHTACRPPPCSGRGRLV